MRLLKCRRCLRSPRCWRPPASLSSGRPQWRGSDNLLRSPGSGARHSPAHRLDAVGAEGRSRRVRRRRGAREGLSPLSARGVGHAPAAAQPSRKSQPSSPDANPVQEVAGTVVRHGWVPLGPTERPPGSGLPKSVATRYQIRKLLAWGCGGPAPALWPRRPEAPRRRREIFEFCG